MKKTVLIIGASSALAQEVMPRLAQGYTLVTAGRSGCDVTIDITQPFVVPKEIDVVVNFAAHFGGTSDEDIMGAVRTNSVGALNICRAAHSAGVEHVITVSSVFTLLDESSPSYSIYALTKKHGDELAEFYCKQHSLPLTILRPSRIYGDSDIFAKNQPFLYQLIDKAQNGEDITIYGTNDASRNYIHSYDLAEIIARSIARRPEGAFVCTYLTNSTYSEIARSAQRVFGKGGSVSFLEDKPDIPSDVFSLDPSLYRQLDYQPQISIEAGIARIKQYRERNHA